MTINELRSIEEIRKTKARYCRYFDTNQWADFFGLFTDDAIFDMRTAASVKADAHPGENVGELQGYQRGRDNIAAYLADIVANISSSVHHLHAGEIELTSPTTATAIWALEDRHQFHAGPIKALHAFGHYHDVFVRERGIWLIKSLRLTRLRVDVEAR